MLRVIRSSVTEEGARIPDGIGLSNLFQECYRYNYRSRNWAGESV